MRKLTLAMILSVGLMLRLAALYAGSSRGGAGLLTPDSSGYLQTAHTLAWDGRFALSPDGPPELARTPGYPLFLAAVMRAEGHRMPAGLEELVEPPTWALLIQALLDVGLVGLTYLLARRLVSAGAALTAAAMQAVAPLAIAAGVRALSDSLFALLLTASLVLLAAFLQKRRWAHLATGAFLLAAAAYVRPIALLLPAPMAVVLLRRGWRPAAAMLGLFAACTVPWAVRNGVQTGYWRFSAIGAVNLYRYEAAAVRAHRSGESLAKTQQRMEDELYKALDDPASLQSPEAYRLMSKRAWQTLRSYPGRAAWEHLKGSTTCLLPGATDLLEVLGLSSGQRGTLDVLRREGLWAAVRHYFGGSLSPVALAVAAFGCLLLALVYAGVAATAVRKLRPAMSAACWLLLVVGVLLLLAPGPAGHPRFRVPALPLLHVAAAASWAWLVNRRTGGQAMPMAGDQVVRPVGQRPGNQPEQPAK